MTFLLLFFLSTFKFGIFSFFFSHFRTTFGCCNNFLDCILGSSSSFCCSCCCCLDFEKGALCVPVPAGCPVLLTSNKRKKRKKRNKPSRGLLWRADSFSHSRKKKEREINKLSQERERENGCTQILHLRKNGGGIFQQDFCSFLLINSGLIGELVSSRSAPRFYIKSLFKFKIKLNWI